MHISFVETTGSSSRLPQLGLFLTDREHDPAIYGSVYAYFILGNPPPLLRRERSKAMTLDPHGPFVNN
jgi:hypothetical protein